MKTSSLCTALVLLVAVSGTPTPNAAQLPANDAQEVVAPTTAAEDLVVNLPGLGDLEGKYTQYSGYLDGGEGRQLHYWFVESQNNPSSDPLLLWLNGGPGCSSLDGFLTEHGPFTINDDLTLSDNPYSWTTFSSVLYLESPACVGFSYSETDDCATGDSQTAEQNHAALQSFFVKFPSYREHDLFLTGESYAGVYIPTLADYIVQHNEEYAINLAGFAIGNGLLSYSTNSNSIKFYQSYHALFGQELWADLVANCCPDGVMDERKCDFFTNENPACSKAQVQAYTKTVGLNIYNLYGTCEESSAEYSTPLQRAVENLHMKPGLLRSDPQVRLTPGCTDVDTEMAYLNSPEVREAIHIPDHVQDWEICSSPVNRHYAREVQDVTDQFQRLKAAGIRGLVFNGDFDMACNYLGNQWFVEDLAYNVTAAHRKWHVGSQVGGTVKQWELLDMVTVRGAGHMVPTDKPVSALKMIMSFVYGTDY